MAFSWSARVSKALMGIKGYQRLTGSTVAASWGAEYSRRLWMEWIIAHYLTDMYSV